MAVDCVWTIATSAMMAQFNGFFWMFELFSLDFCEHQKRMVSSKCFYSFEKGRNILMLIMCRVSTHLIHCINDMLILNWAKSLLGLLAANDESMDKVTYSNNGFQRNKQQEKRK